LNGPALRPLGQRKRNPVAFLGPDIIGVGPQFLGFVPKPIALLDMAASGNCCLD
jgi:hypothetical protein